MEFNQVKSFLQSIRNRLLEAKIGIFFNDQVDHRVFPARNKKESIIYQLKISEKESLQEKLRFALTVRAPANGKETNLPMGGEWPTEIQMKRKMFQI